MFYPPKSLVIVTAIVKNRTKVAMEADQRKKKNQKNPIKSKRQKGKLS